MPDFPTFIADLRPFGNGTPFSYRYDRTAFTGDVQVPVGNPSNDLNQGEMCAFDATNNRVVRFQRSGANGKFVGVSRDSATGPQKLGNQPALLASLNPFSVWTTGIHGLLGTVGETYTHGNPVYMAGTSTNTITKTAAGGVQVGIVHNPQNLSFVGAVRVPILIDEFTITQA